MRTTSRCQFNTPSKTAPFRLTLAAMLVSSFTASLQAQDAGERQPTLEEVVVTGIRGSLQSAIDQKRDASSLVEVIMSEDIGKLPDQNLAEVLENITGIQITREAGVGTGVQIRGTNANRTEINGVSTVGSGAGRSGIDFEDISASIIAGVEVTKASEAKTIEGSVGGTINLRTIRPLELKEMLLAGRVQFEESSLSADDDKYPRYSGTWGDNWTTANNGDFGVVIGVSYSEQDVSAFRPRTDRDNFVFSDSGVPSAQSFDYLPIQFFVQDYDNLEYETTNYTGSFEWAPNDNLKLYFDTVITDQQRIQESSRIQASGVSDLRGVRAPDSFETVNFGSLRGSTQNFNLGSIQAALTGSIPVEAGGADPNLRMSTDTGSRETESELFRLGADWQINERFSMSVELASTKSDSATGGGNDDSINTTLNFINPNVPTNSSNENGTPFVYNLTSGLTWAVDQSAGSMGPTTAQLLDPANYVLRDVNLANDIVENQEDAFRLDFTYDFEWEGFTSVDFGFRYSESSSLNDDSRINVGLRNLADSPTGDLFAEILVPGPDNFDDADGRDLFVQNYLYINPELINNNPGRVIDVLNAAITANNAITGSTQGPISSPTSSTAAFFDIKEETNAFYVQANFEMGIFRGNVGVRYVETDVNSKGFAELNGVVSPISEKTTYDFVLPRFNLAADVTEDIIVRMGWGEDIRRPDFDDLSSAFQFSTSPNPSVNLGNPALKPETVESFDISVEWYFAPSSVVSVGFFDKKRSGLFVSVAESPFEDPVTGFRDTTAPCEQGGIFNPIADINVFGPVPGVGVCVPSSQTINGQGETRQKGWEFAVQYDLADFEDQLGWASGFGIIANYTIQEFSGTPAFDSATSRAQDVFSRLGNNNVDLRAQLLDLSETAYNFTLYYEKYDLSARMRYTWREAYRSEDFGSTSSKPWGFPVVQEDRGQLNASINYDINDNFNISLEGVNLTEEEVVQSCVNEGSLLCFEGYTDRRITAGVSYKY